MLKRKITVMNTKPFFACSSLMIALVLAGCSVGPDYHGPGKTPQVNQFARLPQSGVNTAPGVARWWETLNDPQLNTLIAMALKNNPDIAIAQARLRQARAALDGQQANEYPKLGADGAALRAKLPDSTGITSNNPLNMYANTFDASWELDIFGGTRRAIESARAQAQASQESLADTHVSIAAEVARNYLELCGQRQQLAVLQQSIALEQQMLTLTQQRYSRGAANDSDVQRLVTQLETTRSQIPSLLNDITNSLDTLAFLAGKTPGELDQQLNNVMQLPTLPAQVNVGDPTTLLRQRPDVREAERKLAASNAEIGEHIADYYPKVNFLGNLGFTSSSTGNLWQRQNLSWMLVPYLQWNILDFGRIKSQVASARAARDEAQANWQKSVLSALRDANGSLSRYGQQRQTVMDLATVTHAADRASQLMQQRYKAGAASLIDYLDTERSRLSAQQNQISAQTQLVTDFVAVQKSLGLGWQS